MDLTARLEGFCWNEAAGPGVVSCNQGKSGPNRRKSAEQRRRFSGPGRNNKEFFQQAEQQVKAIVVQHTDDIQSMAGSMRETMEKSQREVADKVDGIIAAAIERYAEQTSAELDRIAKAWGGNLVSIAEECAKAIDGRRRGL